MDFLFKFGGLAVVANDRDDTAPCRHAQFGEQVTDELNVAVVHPVESYGIHVVNDNVSFNHSMRL